MPENAAARKPLHQSSPATVQDVARLAGVSASTVSRILNGTARVSEAKQRSVEEAIRRLKFRPNLSAQGLRTGTTRTIGVLTQDLECPYFTTGTRGAEEALEESGFALMVVTGNGNKQTELERAHLLIARKVDALIILSGNLSDDEIAELAQHQPISVTGRHVDAPNVTSFHCDQVECGLLATEHLIQLGHTRIAHIAGTDHHRDSGERRDGYLLAHKRAGLSVDPRLIISGDFLEASGEACMAQLLDTAPAFTAVFCANDQMLWGARRTLHQRGVPVPETISLVGVDDLPPSAFMTPPVTTVRQPIRELGRAAASSLLQLLGAVPKQPIPPAALRLVVRQTTAAPTETSTPAH